MIEIVLEVNLIVMLIVYMLDQYVFDFYNIQKHFKNKNKN
jgi:hypothetical protein